jgi:transposase InsO family protein
MRTHLPLAVSIMAAQRQRQPSSLTNHSGRGSQYAARPFFDHLAEIAATPSISRSGNCYYNAPMESFFHTFKVELVHQCRWATNASARQALFARPQSNRTGPRKA